MSEEYLRIVIFLGLRDGGHIWRVSVRNELNPFNRSYPLAFLPFQLLFSSWISLPKLPLIGDAEFAYLKAIFTVLVVLFFLGFLQFQFARSPGLVLSEK